MTKKEMEQMQLKKVKESELEVCREMKQIPKKDKTCDVMGSGFVPRDNFLVRHTVFENLDLDQVSCNLKYLEK
ncbi:unnamed protein product [Moneuplotes crassus]|uniref:Uncharacterized protein n=1 Tax=Euplotes crassus TaxID=5936 RepID=A0AAD1XKX0_EUPCR|nr:unnamed protein product [Moneuplotes crassus]